MSSTALEADAAMRAPAILALDHVQLAIAPGSEERCRAFYVELLGMTELVKPPVLSARGGLWLRAGTVEIHLGVEQDFRPARKAHPALRVASLDALADRLAAAGYALTWDDVIAGTRRFFVNDPLGNRLEFIAA
jgi:catechol 2,3-dioxygenase-like lactoylglutathione lyase family enzyme